MVSNVMNHAAHTLPTGQFGSAPSDLPVGDEDEESIRLAISLQLADIQNTHGVSTQLSEGGDAAVLVEYRRYLEDAERFFADRKVAEALAAETGFPQSMEVDVPHRSGSRNTDHSAVNSSPPDSPRTLDTAVLPDNDVDMSDIFEEEIQLACAISLEMYKAAQEKAEEEKEPIASSSKPGATATASPVIELNPSCTCCTETFKLTSLIISPCAHPYCISCLKQLFMGAVEDRQLFPPRCCKRDIPLYLIQRHLSKQELRQFRSKVTEYTSEEKIYCSNPACSLFIPPSAKNASGVKLDVVICKSCKKGTCLHCNGPEHLGDCPKDPELTAVLSIGAELGMQRCQSCGHLVWKDFGCRHMSCLCGAEWCYRCAALWKTCECSDFESEDEIQNRRTVEELMLRREDQTELEQRREERERERAAAWKVCDHGGKLSERFMGSAKGRARGNWNSINGKAKEKERIACMEEPLWAEEGLWRYKLGEACCDICGMTMKDYIWACDGCSIESCMACREEGLDI